MERVNGGRKEGNRGGERLFFKFILARVKLPGCGSLVGAAPRGTVRTERKKKQTREDNEASHRLESRGEYGTR